MVNEDGCVVTSNFSGDMEGVIGKFVVAPTGYAATLWATFRENPTQFTFATAYKIDENTGKKELVEISLVMKHEQSPVS